MSVEFPVGLEWVNVERPVPLETLRGQVVVLLFWTYSSAHCQRLLPALRTLHAEHEAGLSVLGIHCPKFPHERELEHVASALQRHFVRFPVASDPGFEVWHQFGVEAWPTVAVLDSRGRLRALLKGDDVGEALGERVRALAGEASEDGTGSLEPALSVRPPAGNTLLRFPTAVLAARGNLYISDTAHNRVLEVDGGGRLLRVFGSGSAGFWDGHGENCGFDTPRGLAVSEDFLYVADTGNHSIRRVNLFSAEVETVVGNGRPDAVMTEATPRLREVGVPAPVGLAADGPMLYVSSSGLGQIWRLDLGRGVLGWFSGTGQPGVVDGERLQAAFAQPAGVALHQGLLYVADADGSALREVRCQTGHVQTRVGRSAFEFGDSDGLAVQASFQYPMGVAVPERGREVWVADSFNDRLRVFDRAAGRVNSPDLHYAFCEPAGIAAGDGVLWVANTNAHEIVRVDPLNQACEPLEIVTGG